MITRIVSYLFLGMLFFAFFLAILGVQEVATGDEYYSFLKTIGLRFESWKISIPDIPTINTIDAGDYDSSGLILQVLIKIANFFVNIVNVISRILNILILFINIVIQIIQFICTLLTGFKDLIQRLRDLNSPESLMLVRV